MREIDLHHDGHGLNESIVIRTDDPDESGGAHYYALRIGATVVGELQFQKGGRDLPGSTPGVTEAAVLSVLIDRLRGFQGGPLGCRENAIMITHLEEALHWTKSRADERAKRRVLGTNTK